MQCALSPHADESQREIDGGHGVPFISLENTSGGITKIVRNRVNPRWGCCITYHIPNVLHDFRSHYLEWDMVCGSRFVVPL
jgi:hypothetical protein